MIKFYSSSRIIPASSLVDFVNGVTYVAMSEKLEKPKPKPVEKKPKIDKFIDKVYFAEERGRTTVKWHDGTTTRVTVQEGDKFDKMTGIALCFMKKIYGNDSRFNEVLRKYT